MCSACRAFHPVLNALRDAVPEDLRVVMRYAAFHEGSDEAVRILEAARRQDLFEPVLDALLERQPEWAIHGAPAIDVAQGRNDAPFPGTTAILNQDAADIAVLGVGPTPTFFLDGRRLSEVSFESLRAEVEAAVAA